LSTISDVLTRLEGIIEWAKTSNSPLGYFAVVYHITTAGVKHGIDKGIFDDCARMERLDVVFAERYFEAFDAWQAGRPVTKAWEAAFRAAENPHCTVLQHIVLGMNAHINLDLGIAAAQTAPGSSIAEVKEDFYRINDIIAGLVDEVQDRLAAIFPVFGLLDRALRSRDERMANLTIRYARSGAWTAATTLATLEQQEHERIIRELDAGVWVLASRIQTPGSWLTPALRVVRWGETGSVRRKIEKLQTG
jgi:hypothetical protein